MARLKDIQAPETPELEMKLKDRPDVEQVEPAAPSTRQRRPKRVNVEQAIPEMPQFGNPENMILIGSDWIEIRPTKLLYMRNGTAMFYRIVDTYPTPDIPMLPAGTVDPVRNGDKCLTDWLVAVTDNPEFVAKHINEFDGETIHQMLQIFKRLNHITEKEEELKKAKTQGKEV